MNTGNSITASDWTSWANSVNDMVSSKKTGTATSSTFTKGAIITASQIISLQTAINQLENAFSNNCCQSNCCQSQSCQSQACQSCQTCERNCDCHRNCDCDCGGDDGS